MRIPHIFFTRDRKNASQKSYFALQSKQEREEEKMIHSIDNLINNKDEQKYSNQEKFSLSSLRYTQIKFGKSKEKTR